MTITRPSSSSSDLDKEIGTFGLEVLGRLANQKSWSELPGELVTAILQRLQSYRDFVIATSSCGFWRLIGSNDNTFSGGNQFPWLMLGEEEEGCSSNTNLRGFYNVQKNITCYLELPEANGRKHCVSCNGWLVTVDSSLRMNLVHPLSRVQIKLPDFCINLDPCRFGFDVIWKAAFSSNPGKMSEDYTLCIVSASGRIGLWRKGDPCWREMDEAGSCNWILDIVFYKGRFYSTSCLGIVYAWDIQGTRMEEVARLPIVKRALEYCIQKFYLVESGGTLLMVSRKAFWLDMKDHIECYATYRFQVFEVSWCKSDKSWRQVSDLGGKALFLGFNSSFSVDASDFPGCKPNCIYFTDDWGKVHFKATSCKKQDMGIYQLKDGRFERFPLQSFPHISPPLWVQLTCI